MASAGNEDDDVLDQWFQEFHASKPHVFKWFKQLACEIRAEGHRRYSAKTIMERMRWESPVKWGQEYKMGNLDKDRASARYARLLIDEDPSFKDFFQTRELTTLAQRRRLREAHQELIQRPPKGQGLLP